MESTTTTENRSIPLMTALACLVCVLVFIGLQSGASTTYAETERWGLFADLAVWQGKPWALLTSVFAHLQIWHIVFNVCFLWQLGSLVERYIGVWRWVLFFVGAAWVSSALQLLFGGNMGIGLSGVGYALFGFGWVARDASREIREMLDDQAVKGLLIWLVGCMVVTALGMMRIGNAAHCGGLAFGALVAAVFVRRWRLPLTIPALVAVCALSFVPLVWCPLSSDWNSVQAMRAQDSGDLEEALVWYRRSLARGGDRTFVWANIAIIQALRGNVPAYNEAIGELRKANPGEAAKLEQEVKPTK